MSNRIVLGTMIAAAMAAGLAGCGPKDEGVAKSYRLESRLPDEGNQLGSADLLVATDKAVAGIAAVPDIRQAGGAKTVIVLDRVDNQTSDPSANFQIYLARIRAALNQSGARQNLVFIETRKKAEAIADREGFTETARMKPRYALTGSFYDMPRGKTNYHLLTFQLMDLTNQQIVWEGSYEVKL